MGNRQQIIEGAKLANYLVECGIKTNIICVPLTTDASLMRDGIDFAVGFDTVSKKLSQHLGALITDNQT
jgi:6-phosphofructokinase